jgi:hypothetical protein
MAILLEGLLFWRLVKEMKIFGKQNNLWSLNPKILIGVCLICGLFSIIVYSKTSLNNQPFNLAQSMLIVSNNFTRNALLEAKLQKHIVKRDETLVQISGNYFASLQDLQGINQISNLSSLQAGRILYIPPLDQSATFLQKYQVKSGDSVDSRLAVIYISKLKETGLN